MIVQLRRGDTLWYLSQLFGIPLTLVIDSNRGVTPTSLQPGQQINIPGYEMTNYIIRRGDTLWAVAMNHQIPLDMLLLVNQAIQPNQLTIGTSIQLPKRVTSLIVFGKRNYDYASLLTDLQRLVEIYPFIQRRSIGNSVMGKSIPEIIIGQGNKRVHMNGSFHANEWITTPILMQFLNEYLLALTNGTQIRGIHMDILYRQNMLSIVPMVNPDGVNLVINGLPNEVNFRDLALRINGGSENFSGWKANIRGVDLNDQFPAFWELEAERRPKVPSPRDYPGTAPLTEPESIAMANMTREGNFRYVLAFHTQGKVIYWGFMDMEPPESEVIANEFGRVSGYTPIRRVDSYAGYKDWFIQDWRRPGFTIELGQGVNPLPITQFDEIYEQSLGIMLAALYM